MLKLESPLFKHDAMKKDIAAAELEHLGYAFLEKNGANARSYLAGIGQILEQRHLSIVGASSTSNDTGNANTASKAKHN